MSEYLFMHGGFSRAARAAAAISAALPLLIAVNPAAAQRPGGLDPAARALVAGAKFKLAKQTLDGDYDRTVKDIVDLTEIESPPFKENARARAYLAMLKAQGLTDVEMDGAGSVMGLRKGTGGGPLIVIAAHLDTVFPAGTDVKVKREGNKLLAPGIGDDTSSLGVLLAFVRAMDAAKFETRADILFMGDVGEEGPGDLRGMKYLFNQGKYKDRIKYFISFEPGRAAEITNGGVGSKRYKVTFTGPGGHSMGDFGIVNPAYAMANAITAFGRMKVPAKPRTVYNVGIVEGGTSVNSIPFSVAMTIDMRSAGKAELDRLEHPDEQGDRSDHARLGLRHLPRPFARRRDDPGSSGRRRQHGVGARDDSAAGRSPLDAEHQTKNAAVFRRQSDEGD